MDLNKVCTKDNYSLPNTDQLVDSIIGFEYLNSLDADFGYHQILMHLDDEEKIAFINKSRTFCYEVMSFRLKNDGVTYQWMVNKIFNNQLRRIIEGYVDDMLVKSMVVDDMLVKSMTFKQYFLYLKEVFFVLVHHQFITLVKLFIMSKQDI
jgi:hypothetical protein